MHDEPRGVCPRIARRVGLGGAFALSRLLLVDALSGVDLLPGSVVGLRHECFLLR